MIRDPIWAIEIASLGEGFWTGAIAQITMPILWLCCHVRSQLGGEPDIAVGTNVVNVPAGPMDRNYPPAKARDERTVAATGLRTPLSPCLRNYGPKATSTLLFL